MKKVTLMVALITATAFQYQVLAGWIFPLPGESFDETAKSTMSSVVENTRSIYSADMNEANFLDKVLAEIPPQKRSKEIVDYFKKVYYYHQNDFTERDINNKENGETLKALAELAEKRGSVESAFFKDPYDPAIPAFRPFKWWLRLIIEILIAVVGII